MSLTKEQQERCNQLVKLDMQYDGQSYFGKLDINRDFNVHWTELICDTDEQWDAKIKKLTDELTRRRLAETK